MKNAIILVLITLLLIAGCKEEEQVSQGTGIGANIGTVTPVEEQMLDKCIQLCNNFKADKTEGPCIGNPMADDWVCDIAHVPRKDIDNQMENQCSKYNSGSAEHFVEVDESCKLIRMK